MINWLKWLLLAIVTLVIILSATLYLTLHLSLPILDGNSKTHHVDQPTSLSRDEIGHAVIEASNVFDAAYALGFAHAQDRLFQMDLQRRSASGSLSQWVGDAALEIDKAARFHQFQQRAYTVFDNLPSKQ